MIRAATAADLPVLLAMGEAMLGAAPHFAAVPVSVKRLADSLAVLIDCADALVAIAEVQGRPAGAMIAFAAPHWASEVVEVSEIALYVDPAHRRAGVAAALIGRFVEFAREKGAALTRAGASAGICDDAVVRAYERAGFRVCGACLQL